MQTNFQSSENSADHLNRLGDLTRAYARFAQSAAGLGNVLGGVLAMVMWITSNLIVLPLWSRLLFALFPIAWIILKELLRHRYYLRHGLARQVWCSSDRRWHIGLTAFMALISLFIISMFGYGWWQQQTIATWQALGYIAFVVAMPVCVWFYMRTTEEFFVGVLLFVQAAVIVAGGHYPLLWWPLLFPLFTLFAIAVGIKQHRDYRKIDRELRQMSRRP